MTPWTSPTPTTVQPIIGVAFAQMIGGPNQLYLHNVRPASNVDELSGVEGLMPKFARRRSAPANHQVVSDEVDAEMYDGSDSGISSMKGLAEWLKEEKDESKDEPLTRLRELSAFALCGFGQFDAPLGIGVYNKERRASLLRQGLTERGRLRGRGVRLPV